MNGRTMFQVKQKTAAEVARREQEDDEEDEAHYNYSEANTFRSHTLPPVFLSRLFWASV
jgi:hypothetical protein